MKIPYEKKMSNKTIDVHIKEKKNEIIRSLCILMISSASCGSWYLARLGLVSKQGFESTLAVDRETIAKGRESKNESFEPIWEFVVKIII
jgi:hypothetical protein